MTTYNVELYCNNIDMKCPICMRISSTHICGDKHGINEGDLVECKYCGAEFELVDKRNGEWGWRWVNEKDYFGGGINEKDCV